MGEAPVRTGGIVLCGGESSRMGRPKAWLPFGGETMLQRIVGLLRGVLDPVVVVAAPGQALPILPPGVTVARDLVEGGGPLNALATGLAAIMGVVDAAYVSACDVPLLNPEFVRLVVEALSGDRTFPSPAGAPQIAVPFVGARYHPLAAAYHVSILPELRALLAAGQSRLHDVLDLVPKRVVTESELASFGLNSASLWNVNTPEEYAAALRWYGD